MQETTTSRLAGETTGKKSMRNSPPIKGSDSARKSLILGLINTLEKANNFDGLISDNSLITRDNSGDVSG